MKRKRYTVSIGDLAVRVSIDLCQEIDEYGTMAKDMEGTYHHPGGLMGAAIDRAVRNAFGRRCFWFGEYDDRFRGQVFEALRATKYNSNPGNSARTPTVVIDVQPGW